MAKRDNKTKKELDVARLIAKDAKLNQKIKADQAELTADKEVLTDWYVAEGHRTGRVHPGYDNTQLAITETPTYDPIDINELKNLLDLQGKGGQLFECLTVSMSGLKKVLGAEDISKLQGEAVGTKYALAFKVLKGR